MAAYVIADIEVTDPAAFKDTQPRRRNRQSDLEADSWSAAAG